MEEMSVFHLILVTNFKCKKCRPRALANVSMRENVARDISKSTSKKIKVSESKERKLNWGVTIL